MPPRFRELSSLDQFRVCRFLTRGEAPDDPEVAAITLETAKHYQVQSRVLAGFLRWWPVVLALPLVLLALPDATAGQPGMMAFLLFIALGVAANFMLNPWTRPKNVVKSMEASRQIVVEAASRGE